MAEEVRLTEAEQGFLYALGEFRTASGLGAMRLGRLVDCSPHTVKSLLCGRRRPGAAVLRQIEVAMDALLRSPRYQHAHFAAGQVLDAVREVRRERAGG